MLGARLKQLRNEKVITQQELADLLNVGRPTVAGYETKGKEPDFAKLIVLAEYFEVSIDYLLCKTDNRNQDFLEKENKLLQEEITALKELNAKLQSQLNYCVLLDPD
jgi:transcriptional regulator with XRE-family HTH domain